MNIVRIVILLTLFASTSLHAGIRLKEIGRFEGIRDNQLVGYGLVVGLASTGDSSRNKSTIQSIANTLIEFGINIDASEIKSRNVAAVMVTGILPSFSEKGEKIDVTVSSMGDARSLAGGTLVMTPLKAANNEIYALAQGSLSVGGFAFESFDSLTQKNHPTVAKIANGGLIERSTKDVFFSDDGELTFIIHEPDFSTLERVSEAIESKISFAVVTPIHAGKLSIKIPNDNLRDFFDSISAIESIEIIPDQRARVVINERTGTLVAGGDVRISSVTISHGSLRLVVDTKYDVSQPDFFGIANSSGIRTQVVPNTSINVIENEAGVVEMSGGGTVADLVESLRSLNVTTRDIIIIIQSIKRAGALHSEFIVE
jgi:flagellar P-ring protein precursor FlgI